MKSLNELEAEIRNEPWEVSVFESDNSITISLPKGLMSIDPRSPSYWKYNKIVRPPNIIQRKLGITYQDKYDKVMRNILEFQKKINKELMENNAKVDSVTT